MPKGYLLNKIRELRNFWKKPLQSLSDNAAGLVKHVDDLPTSSKSLFTPFEITNADKISDLNADKITSILEDAGQSITRGDRVVLKLVDNKVIDITKYDDALIPTILKSENDSITKVYQLDGVGYKGIEPIYTNVTDYVLRQAHSKIDNLKPAAAQAGNEGVGRENNLETTGNAYIKNKKPVEVKQFHKELLKDKPKYSPTPDAWLQKGGRVYIDEDGIWTYLDWENRSVSYPDGYPDFNSAGLVRDEIELDVFVDYNIDFPRANQLSHTGSISDFETWHHHQDLKTMQKMDSDLHRRFTHKGGMAGRK